MDNIVYDVEINFTHNPWCSMTSKFKWVASGFIISEIIREKDSSAEYIPYFNVRRIRIEPIYDNYIIVGYKMILLYLDNTHITLAKFTDQNDALSFKKTFEDRWIKFIDNNDSYLFNKRLDSIEKKIDDLFYAPGLTGYINAKEHFDETIK